jgi:GT2 family glycosyltransferase
MLERQYSRFRSGQWQVRGSNLYSGNFSIRRERFVAAGGFDESFKRQEDVELGLRLEARGMRFAFDMEAEGLHRPVRTYRSWYETPYIYGVRDVQMARDKGQEVALDLARRHYKGRNRATRVLARLCVGRRPLDSLLFACLRPAAPSFDRVGLRKPALALCSITFNLRYLQGMAREFGGARRMWEALG